MGYAIDTTKSIWRITFLETLTNDDLRKLLDDADAIEKPAPVVANRIVDFRQLETINIGFHELSDFAAGRRRLGFPNNLKSAILTNNPVQYGFARMFQTILEHPQITVRIFNNETDAIEWLSQSDIGTK